VLYYRYTIMEATLTANDLRDVELLDTADVAARLDLSPSRVHQLEREGCIQAVRTASGRRVFLGTDVDAFQRQRAHVSAREARE